MTTEKVTNFKQPRASVLVDGTWIEAHLWIDDQEGAAFLTSKGEDTTRAEAAETALRVGLRALAAADVTVTSRLLDEKLERIVAQATQAAETSLAKASSAFHDKWSQTIDVQFSARLEGHRMLIEERLAALFGEGSESSIQAGMRKFLTQYHEVIAKEIGEDRLRLRRELSDLINGTGDPLHPLALIQAQLGELRKEVAVELEAARAATVAQQTRKNEPRAGFDYQAAAHAEIVALMQGSDDEVELKGRSPGATGGADGDIVILVDPRLTGGAEARIAIEVTKEQKLSVASLKRTLKKSMVDRDAQVAIMVIQDPAILGNQRLQFFAGLGVVAIWDPADADEVRALPLLVAIKHARAVAVQAVRPAADERDDARIKAASEKAKLTIGELLMVLASQARIIKLAQQTTTATSEIQRAVLDAIDQIEDAMSG